jgi:hypothetical protein
VDTIWHLQPRNLCSMWFTLKANDILILTVMKIAGAAISLSFFIKNPYSADWPFWTIRACGASFYVTNLPYWWTLLRRMFNLHSFDANADTNYWRSANSPDCTNIGNDMSRK